MSKNDIDMINLHEDIFREVFEVFKEKLLESELSIDQKYSNAETVIARVLSEFYIIIMDQLGKNFAQFFIKNVFEHINKWESFMEMSNNDENRQ